MDVWYTRAYRIKNIMIRGQVGVPSIEDKMSEARLRRFGYIRRRSMDAPVMRCEKINLPGCRRGRGRSKKS